MSTAATTARRPNASRLEAAAPAGPPWGVLEAYTVAIYLSSALLFIPEAQSVRFWIRGLPYGVSLLLLMRAALLGRVPGAGWSGRFWLLVAMGALGLGMI